MERADHIQNGLVGVYREMDGTRKNEETHKEIKKRAGPQALCLSQYLLCCYLRLSLLRTTTTRRKKKNKIEEREGKKESVSRRRYEVEGVGKREREKKTGDHLLAKKPSGDLWPWRNQRREEWADARRGKLSAHVSQAADKCATIADKAQNDNTWCACMCVCAGQQLTTFKSQLLLYVVDD